MADNVTIPATGTGTATPVVATDERSIGGSTVQVQRVGEIGSGTLAAAQTTISNSSTAIVAARDTRKRVIIVNRQTVPVFIDGGTATTADFRLDPGDSVTLYTTSAINGITTNAYTASGDAKVHSLEEYD